MEVQLYYRNDINQTIMRLVAIKPAKRILRMPAVEMIGRNFAAADQLNVDCDVATAIVDASFEGHRCECDRL